MNTILSCQQESTVDTDQEQSGEKTDKKKIELPKLLISQVDELETLAVLFHSFLWYNSIKLSD